MEIILVKARHALMLSAKSENGWISDGFYGMKNIEN